MKSLIDVYELAKTLTTAQPASALDASADEVLASGQSDGLLGCALQLASATAPEQRVEVSMNRNPFKRDVYLGL